MTYIIQGGGNSSFICEKKIACRYMYCNILDHLGS